jgi:alkylhydroperoxidase family enzyme
VSRKTPRVLAGALAVHFVALVVHAMAHLHLEIMPSANETAAIVAVYYLLPGFAAWSLWRGSMQIGAFTAIAGLAVAMAHGAVRHFLASSPDRIDQLPAGSMRTVFVVSAIALAIADLVAIASASRVLSIGGILHGAIARADRRLGVSSDYLRFIADAAPRRFVQVAGLGVFASGRSVLPTSVWHVARIEATRLADCGACVQITVTMALQDGVEPELLRLAIAGADRELPGELATIQRFVRAVIEQSPELDELRNAVRARYGDGGVVEASLAIASAYAFPLIKRGLGFAISCSKVVVDVPQPAR